MNETVAVPVAPTRREAIAGRFTRYYGRQCRKGHPPVRFTSSGTCVSCDSERHKQKAKGYCMAGIDVARSGDTVTISVPPHVTLVVKTKEVAQ